MQIFVSPCSTWSNENSHYQITPKNDNTTSIFCVSCKYSWLRVGIKSVIWKNSRNKEVLWRFYINIETALGCMFHTLDLGVFKEELCTTFASYRVQHCQFSCSHDANISLHFKCNLSTLTSNPTTKMKVDTLDNTGRG